MYIEFSQPSSKLLDWLDEHQVEYLVDADMLCVFKPKSNNENIYLEDRQKINAYTTIDNNNNNNNNINNINNNKTNIKDICTCDIENNNMEDEVTNTLELKSFNKNNFITNYFNNNQIKYEEKDKYYMLDSNYVNLNKEDIIKLLDNIVLTGTKGVVDVIPKYVGDEFYIEVIGTNLDSLFNNSYIDKTRSRYLVYSNSMDIDFELRKKNILMQLQRIVNVDSSSYNQNHIELLTDFMCRNNEITPMSRFGMKNGDYSFISQLSFENPYSVIQDVVYGTEDNLTSVSSKLITGIYNNNNLTNISSKLIKGISNEIDNNNNDNNNDNDNEDNNYINDNSIDNINEKDEIN